MSPFTLSGGMDEVWLGLIKVFSVFHQSLEQFVLVLELTKLQNSLFAGQLYKDKSLALCACNLLFFTTDLQTQQFTARADLFIK